MSLRIKSVLILFPVLMLMVAIQAIISWQLIYPSFEKLELNELELNTSRVIQAINQELKYLDSTCEDWASWDDSVNFIENRNEEYIESNLASNFFTDLGINFIQYVDNSGNIQWRRGFDFNHEVEQEIFSIPNIKMDPSSPLLPRTENDNLDVAVNTFLNENGQLFLVVSRPIINSEHKGPVRGALIMGKLLDHEVIVNNTHVDFKIGLASNYEFDPNSLNKGKGSIIETTDDLYRVISPVYDVYEKIIFFIDINFKRHITQQGSKSISTSVLITILSGFMGILILLYFIDRYILLRLSNFAKFTQKIQTNMEQEMELDNNRDDEIGHIYKSFNQLLSTIRMQTRELKSQSLTDPLTNLGNRRLFDMTIKNEWLRNTRDKNSLALIICDIDYFKKYNDYYGHQKGDECIVRISKALKNSVKRAGDTVARYGGEEFVVVMPNTDLAGAKIIAKKIQENIAALKIPHVTSKASDYVTLSIGIACIVPDGGEDYEMLIKHADEALYQSKGNGRNQYVIYGQVH